MDPGSAPLARGWFFMFGAAAKTARANTVAPARLGVGLPAVAACVGEELAGGMYAAPTKAQASCFIHAVRIPAQMQKIVSRFIRRGGIYAARQLGVCNACD